MSLVKLIVELTMPFFYRLQDNVLLAVRSGGDLQQLDEDPVLVVHPNFVLEE